jgi:hypothetical protein
MRPRLTLFHFDFELEETLIVREPGTGLPEFPSVPSDKFDTMSDRKMNDYRITVRFPAELRRRLKAAARRSGIRESDLVRGAVERQLAAEEGTLTAYELAKKAGLIGAVRGTSPDLSTDRRHFDGFGRS